MTTADPSEDIQDRDEIIRELYQFITELDPEPCPVSEYIADLHLGAVADAIVGPDA